MKRKLIAQEFIRNIVEVKVDGEKIISSWPIGYGGRKRKNMAKREEMLQKDLLKALKGGKEMLERAKFLEDEGLKIVHNSKEDSPEWRQGLTMQAFAWELRNFYAKMFN